MYFGLSYLKPQQLNFHSHVLLSKLILFISRNFFSWHKSIYFHMWTYSTFPFIVYSYRKYRIRQNMLFLKENVFVLFYR